MSTKKQKEMIMCTLYASPKTKKEKFAAVSSSLPRKAVVVA
jgi:hypothetical protein